MAWTGLSYHTLVDPEPQPFRYRVKRPRLALRTRNEREIDLTGAGHERGAGGLRGEREGELTGIHPHAPRLNACFAVPGARTVGLRDRAAFFGASRRFAKYRS